MRGFPYWWRRHHHCHPSAHVHAAAGYGAPESDPREGYFAHSRHRGPPEGWSGDDGEGASFGVRRPLRFMAHKLELSDEQVEKLAVILNDLKTERAQAAVDYRRTVNAMAEALASPTFDESKAQAAGEERVKSAEHVRGAVQDALRRVHGILDDEQRQRLAYLMRTGALTI
ncbi:MAG: Spy/CpxP family protein refolding chaperone [Myxococcota bacterium]|nr:Spy/CpxP family protein refolding chaperone [Myxococcota bacterium]